jgi:hypothetical protein
LEDVHRGAHIKVVRPEGQERLEAKELRAAASGGTEWLERLVPAERITEARVNELAAVVDRYRPGSKY